MVDRLKKIPIQLLEQWKKYTSRQRTIIISAVAFVFLSLVLLVTIMNRVEYKSLMTGEEKKDVSTVAELLKTNSIAYKLGGTDDMTILVDAKKYSEALLLIYSSDISTSGITLDELTNNSISTTNSDRNLKTHLYIQSEIRKSLMTMNGISDAQITYVPQDNSYSVLSEKQDNPVSVALTVTKDFDVSEAEAIAEYVAAAVGNESTDKVKVIDQDGNLLFGGKDDLYSGSANSVLEYKQKLENNYNNNICMLMMKLGYTDVQPMFNWSLNMDKVTQMYTEQIPADGQDQGLYKKYYTYDTQNTTSSGGTPGTDSNDNTTYDTQNSSDSGSSSSSVQIEYIPSERVTNTEYEIGAVKASESTGSIVCTQVVTYKESDLKLQGLLKNTTFDKYVLANSAKKEIKVSTQIYQLVANATGVPSNNISIIAYEQPVFIPDASTGRDWTFYASIVLAVAIVALLLYVVFKGTAPMEVTELEPELSVEQLLATTKENQSLDNIELNEQSETKKMIDKFVEENPEAVAQLLRNWLNEEWN